MVGRGESCEGVRSVPQPMLISHDGESVFMSKMEKPGLLNQLWHVTNMKVYRNQKMVRQCEVSRKSSFLKSQK